jgi:hypothetical protein
MNLLSLILDHSKMFELKVDDYAFYSFWLSFVFLSLAYVGSFIITHIRKYSFVKFMKIVSFLFEESKDGKFDSERFNKLNNEFKKDYNEETFRKQRFGDVFIMLFCVITFSYLAPLQTIPSKDDNVGVSTLSNNQLKISRFGVVDDKNIPVNVSVVSCGDLSVKECLSKHNL